MAVTDLDIQSASDRVMRYAGRGALMGFPTSAGTCDLTTGVPTNGTKGFCRGALFHNFIGGTVYVNVGTYDSSNWSIFPLSGNTIAALTITALTATAASIGPVTFTGAETSAVGASTAAAGTTFADAGALPAGTAKLYPTTAADDTAGVIINAADKVTGRMLFIGNGVSNKILKVYGPSGAVINGAAANAAFSSASGKGVWIFCLSGAGNTWLAG